MSKATRIKCPDCGHNLVEETEKSVGFPPLKCLTCYEYKTSGATQEEVDSYYREYEKSVPTAHRPERL